MKKFVRTVFISFTIWVAASLVNAALISIWSMFISRYSGERLPIVLAIGCSLVFSIPAIFIFWIFFIANYREEGLFQLLLRTALFTSLFSALIVFGVINRGFHRENYWFVLFAVTAAIISVMAHRSSIYNIVNENKNQTDV